MSDVSQAELLQRHRGGDRSAFAQLVRLHQGPLLRHARGVLGPGSPYEDVVQEAFLKLAQAPPVLPPEVVGDPEREHGQIAAWLHTVTRNLCMDVMRSETRRKKRERDAAAPEAFEGGLSAVEAADTRTAVERTLAKLPVDQREVLVLRLLGERSYREIAEITGRKIGTVGWLVSVGLKALAAELAPVMGAEAGDAEPGTGFGMVRGELS